MFKPLDSSDCLCYVCVCVCVCFNIAAHFTEQHVEQPATSLVWLNAGLVQIVKLPVSEINVIQRIRFDCYDTHG